MTDELLRRLLDEIERRELSLLSWGVTNGAFSELELETILRDEAPTEDPSELIDALLQRGLIVEKGVTRPRYRSRMAETVRLATTLRQWFHGRDWRTAPTLVSDSRFLSRTRLVPRRDCTADALTDELRSTVPSWTSHHERLLSDLLAGRSVSAFQARATARLIRPGSGQRGTVVTAGTGAGKTLAFYLPVLTHLMANEKPPGTPRVIAIYPRIELLRDQLRSLLTTCRELADQGARPPTVGVLYGSVPQDRLDAARNPDRGWTSQGSGLRSPILDCLRPGCGGAYLWPDDTGIADVLVCDRCSDQLTGDRLRFTRQRLLASPPDVLFTTTEMLNRLLGSPRWRRILVGDGNRSPEYLLLDEIHTYSGTHGAQVAHLLRRWRSELAAPPHIVGLSATLADPTGFFAQLSGLDTSVLTLVAPEADELEETGSEYFLALRGDPASQTALLSTTIQTSMLLRRMLDPTPAGPSNRTFGSKVFVFTDDLDGVNRLHTQLEDAEGWRPGGVDRKPGGSLAVLRSSTGPDGGAREDAGQLWAAAEQLGTLHRTVRVSRTTSQDGGVDVEADIVVATASLEVGFDDPDVGAVIQHKRPRDAAQFLQRRGRAGRDVRMRPWTAVVLSDYGRDRHAFQSYETLFDPVVQPSHLPLKNRVVLKMQATWWLLDDLSKASGTAVGPLIERRWHNHEQQLGPATRVLQAANEILTPTGVDRLSMALARSLALRDDEVQAILWDYPRGLLTAALPTVIRRLEALTAEHPPDDAELGQPLRDFVPASLFAPLKTPELRLVRDTQAPTVEVEPVAQGLRQFAPGRVSYRYAIRGRRDRQWVAPPASNERTLHIERFFLHHEEIEPPPHSSVRLVQPTAIRIVRPPGTVADSSYGRWNWQVAFAHDGAPLTLDVPSHTAWESVVSNFVALTHRHRCAETVWRFATTFVVERNSPTEPPRTEHELRDHEEPVALGFSMEVDALRLIVRLPESVPTEPRTVRALRVSRFEHVVGHDPILVDAVPSRFTRDWLHQVLLSVLIDAGATGSLEAALAERSDAALADELINAARTIFASTDIDNQPDGHTTSDPGLVRAIQTAIDTPRVIPALRRAAAVLWADPDDTWLPWLQERYTSTLAAAVIDAIQDSCPDVDTSELRCDLAIDGSSTPASAEITISEDQPGGVGTIEAFVDRYVEDPRAFWALVATALGPCDGERVDQNLRNFLAAVGESSVAEPVARIRANPGMNDLIAAWRELRASLFRSGLDTDQTVVSALSTRLLRPGSGPEHDRLVAELLRRWDALETNLGVEIELRVFTFVAAHDPDIQDQLDTVAPRSSGEPGWRVSQLVGLLWPRGGRLRSSALQTYSPFGEVPPSERLLFGPLLDPARTPIDSAQPTWRDAVDDELRRQGSTAIHCAGEGDAAAVIHDLMTRPTSVEALEFHPRIVGLSRSREGLALDVELREARQ